MKGNRRWDKVHGQVPVFSLSAVCDTIGSKEVHMPRLKRRGYGTSRSPELSFKASRTSVSFYVLTLLFFLAFRVSAHAQDVNVHIEPRPPADAPKPDAKDPAVANAEANLKNHTKPVQVDVNLVLVNVTVTDDWNRIVTGLDKENFSILEGNEPQLVKHFSSEDAPLSLGVIFDMSGSMSDKIAKAREAVIEFMKTANPQDEFFMVTFNDRPQLRADFTTSVEEVQGKLVYTVPQGRTALLDAIYMGINKIKEADVQIYAIGVFTTNAPTPEEVAGPALLTEISEVTGGRMFTINNPNELADVATKIGIELRNQYVLGYRPSNRTKDGHWRKIKIKLIPPKGLPYLNVYSKTGYYAPSQ